MTLVFDKGKGEVQIKLDGVLDMLAQLPQFTKLIFQISCPATVCPMALTASHST
jgi:hypothetical protein